MAEHNIKNLMNMCRICLERGEHMINLFSDSDQSFNIISKIFECFQIKLEFKKQFPSLICNKCKDEVICASNFREKCITFEEKFAVYTGHNTETVFDTLDSKEEFSNDIEITNYCNLEKTSSRNDYFMKLEKNTGSKLIKSEDTILKCIHCNKTLKSEASLRKHSISMHEKRTHVGKVTGFGADRRYNCTKCAYTTPHSQTLINHMRRHNGERPHHCDCGKTFTQSSSLAAHRKTHSTDTFYTCAICGKQFKHAFSLKTHLYVHEIGQFACNICKKLLKSKQSFQAHMQRHYNIYNYSCEDCGSAFVTCSELLNHKKKHNVHKNIECHLCEYKTHAKKSMVIHLKRHTGEKSYKCEICALTFYTKGDLQRHKRVHTRDKPFTCPTCGQRFTQSPSLNKHMLSVHGVEYKWSDIKWKESRKIKTVAVNEENDVEKDHDDT